MTITKQTVDISGFGGGYEDMCQRMLWRGVEYLNEVQPPVDMWNNAKQYENVTGIMMVEGDDLKNLEKAILFDSEDCTGAMHQAVMNHLAFIHKHSIDEWLAKFHNDRKYEWTGSLDKTV